jgi:hypothetical protein
LGKKYKSKKCIMKKLRDIADMRGNIIFGGMSRGKVL